MTSAVVIFTDKGAHIFDRWLKPGFKGVVVATRGETHWIGMEFPYGHAEMVVSVPAHVDLAAAYREEGYTVCEARVGTERPRGPVMANSCVGLAKRLLGLRAPLVWTPWQLYCHLQQRG